MRGKLYGIGVGPGDPELLTLKAKRILDGAEVIAVPVKAAGEASTALEIIRPVVNVENKRCMEVVFQMHPREVERQRCRREACERLVQELSQGKSIAMITLGDVSVYSTYMYVNQYVAQAGYETEIIPGIPSFCSGAAAAQLSLMEGNESLAIVPSARDTQNLAIALDHFENLVVMKAGNSMEKLIGMLLERKISLDSATVISCVGMPGEYIGPLDTRREYSYFTTVIIKKYGEKPFSN
ncbi:MAG: precorrin-2 C(20)-methyltransferase [Lachnospiraceae bacterium]|nr:precorrin-2 C(20)-methyltransferase [Lachnospiraceae bacterium]